MCFEFPPWPWCATQALLAANTQTSQAGRQASGQGPGAYMRPITDPLHPPHSPALALTYPYSHPPLNSLASSPYLWPVLSTAATPAISDPISSSSLSASPSLPPPCPRDVSLTGKHGGRQFRKHMFLSAALHTAQLAQYTEELQYGATEPWPAESLFHFTSALPPLSPSLLPHPSLFIPLCLLPGWL